MMSLGLLSGYGSGSESEDEETPNTANTPSVTNNSDDIKDRLKVLSDGVGLALTLPPPPPPSEPQEPLPNPMKGPGPKPKKQKVIPGMSKKEAELLKNAKWMDIVTEDIPEDAERTEFEYNTPLPFSRDRQSDTAADEGEEAGGSGANYAMSGQPEYDYLTYVAEYQNYMAQSAALLQGQEKAKELAEQAAAAGNEAAGDATEGAAATGESGDWDDYMTKYSAWYAQYGAQYNAAATAAGAPPQQPQLRQKTFEELLEQDRQLEAYFNSEPPNEYNTQRDAFKSSFRGTRRYRMLNGGNYNARHFNQLSTGAKKFAEMYPKQKSVFEDKDAYVADKDLPENQDIKSNKQRKKDKWFQGMVEKKKGCKKCGFVFCRCYGWEFKPSHVK